MPSAASTHHSVGNAQRRVWEDDAHFSDALLLPERKTRPQFTLLGLEATFFRPVKESRAKQGQVELGVTLMGEMCAALKPVQASDSICAGSGNFLPQELERYSWVSVSE